MSRGRIFCAALTDSSFRGGSSVKSRPHIAHPDNPFHAHSDEHYSANHVHNHVVSERLSSRRDFLRTLMCTTLAGASMVELAWHRAAWARAEAQGSDALLSDL